MSDIADWVAAIASLGAGVFAFFAHRSSTRSKEAAEKSQQEAMKTKQLLEQGGLEVSLRSMLSARRDQIGAVARDLENLRRGRGPDALSATEKEHLRGIALRFDEAHEEFLNALEQACALYRDGKCDRDRFKKMFVKEVREMVEIKGDSPFSKFVHPEGTCDFKAVWAVYHEWNNLETGGQKSGS